ncbi:hypothetical protein KPL40_13170 [Clostridium gasigenes]|uniref:hypothetical protein n=1 Tax=Clostridium gasigenes TaxID=94869 RepID=UPI001C0AB5DB|nr:hypothetical protein [Clostridium gasigenes]MBU3133403.1 hypothetical protein [Clostridium gasigenes]
MVIDTNVFKALDNRSLKNFFENKGINIQRKIEEYSIDGTIKGYELDLLDNLFSHGFIKINEVEQFLSEEFNYGRAKNVYIEFIENIKSRDISEILSRINSLEIKGYKNASKVNSNYFIYEIRKAIEIGGKYLIESKIDINNGIVSNIRLLLGEGISIEISGRSNNYYSVDIDLEKKILALRMINWNEKVVKDKLPDNQYEDIFKLVKKTFRIEANSYQKENQKIVYNLVNDLTLKVLNDTMVNVNEKVKEDIERSVKRWGKKVLENKNKLTNSDITVLTQTILNNYYRISMTSQHKTLSPKILKEVYKVQAYPRQVKFFDETAGEGRARSSDVCESVLDTSVFYDIKVRLDKEKNIKNTIIYWMSCIGQENFGTVIHLENQNRFKIIFYSSRINKEKFDYVLQEINGYRK